MTRTIANQFPNFDGTFELLPGFSDSSWGNDVCPSQTRTLPDGALLRVWHDFADVERREFDGGCLYAVDLTRDDVQTLVYESNDFPTVAAVVAGFAADGGLFRRHFDLWGQWKATNDPALQSQIADLWRDLAANGSPAELLAWAIWNDKDGDYLDADADTWRGCLESALTDFAPVA